MLQSFWVYLAARMRRDVTVQVGVVECDQFDGETFITNRVAVDTSCKSSDNDDDTTTDEE